MNKSQSRSRRDRHLFGRWPAICLLSAAIPLLLIAPLRAAPDTPALTDSGITSAVKHDLRLEQNVRLTNVDVTTNQGIVTLSRSVDNLLANDRAVRIAESVRGVRGVIDQIAVTPVSRSDQDIRRDILTALLQDPATDSYQVSVSVEHAVATLTGTVSSYAEQQLAAEIAKRVKGLKDLRNNVMINYGAKRTDNEIAADVSRRLQWDIWLNGDPIHVAVTKARVVLTGTVGSAIAQSRAVADAWVNGVMAVEADSLIVDPKLHEEAQKQFQYVIKPDSDIKQAIETAFRFDPRVVAYSPEVTVEGGVAILSGFVGNVKARTAAEQDAANIAGVWHVNNLLEVKPAGRRTDAEMETQLKSALFWDPLLSDVSIDVAVINRVAYLSGAVDFMGQKAEAHDVASRVKGVVLVRNRITIEPPVPLVFYAWPEFSWVAESAGPPPYLSDDAITKQIEDGFFWSPFVDRKEITVTVHGGVATLTGTVGSWIGYGEADKDAHQSGAAAVRNELRIKKGAWF